MDQSLKVSAEAQDASSMDLASLIKVVRGLDQNGSGDDGENLQQLWKSLTTSVGAKFHAAEESSLRWLLKSMNGSSDSHEKLRRYPLTWMILDSVFRRIPLFSLAKSLADRKFLAVLQQSVKDVSQASTTKSAPKKSTKRKRGSTPAFALEDLQTSISCLKTSQALFLALKSLLARIDDITDLSSHDKIGGEHIRSLFCTTSAEVAATIAALLNVCDTALSSEIIDEIEDAESWVKTLSTLWDLHLSSAQDASDVAMYLFNPTTSVLSKLEVFPTAPGIEVSDSLRRRWSNDLQSFMHRNLIIPARAAFLARQEFESITRALDISSSRLAVAAPTLYFLASGSASQSTRTTSERGNIRWMKRIFQAIEEAVRPKKNRRAIMCVVLDQALSRKMPIGVEDLRQVCRVYALEEDDETDWALLGNAASCESGIFQGSDEGKKLLEDVCRRSLSTSLASSVYAAIVPVVEAILQSFRTARDLGSFLKLWYLQLSALEPQSEAAYSPWRQVGLYSGRPSPLVNAIEADMFPVQVCQVIEWVACQPFHAQARCLFADGVARSIRSEPFTTAIDRKLYDLVADVKDTESGRNAAKWRVVSHTLSWGSESTRSHVWAAEQKRLKRIMKRALTCTGREFYEAFKCCCQAWVAMSTGDACVEEVAELVEAYLGKLESGCNTESINATTLVQSVHGKPQDEITDALDTEAYYDWCLRRCSRFCRLYWTRNGQLPVFVQKTLAAENRSAVCEQALWGLLLGNENNINHAPLLTHLLDRIIDYLEQSTGKEDPWPGCHGQVYISVIDCLPIDAISRPHRERIMSILNKSMCKMLASTDDVLQRCKSVLSLASKLTSRPTFYEGMCFADLVELAEGLSTTIGASSFPDAELLEMMERYATFLSLTVRQMTDNIDERSNAYFLQCVEFLVQREKDEKKGSLTKIVPLFLTLLASLDAELQRSINRRSNATLASLSERTGAILSKAVGAVLSERAAHGEFVAVRKPTRVLRLLAAVSAAQVDGKTDVLATSNPSFMQKLDTLSASGDLGADLRGWKMQIFLSQLQASMPGPPRAKGFDSMEKVPSRLRSSLVRDYSTSVVKSLRTPEQQSEYLRDLVGQYLSEKRTDGQLAVLYHVADQVIESMDTPGQAIAFDVATATSQLTFALPQAETRSDFVGICRVLQLLLERRPQALSQWSIELILSTVSTLCSSETGNDDIVSFAWLCKLVEAIIKKHRLRLEGHYHLLLAALQALLTNLITAQGSTPRPDETPQEAKASHFARLITLVCEPTAGAVARSQHRSALDSATDAAKRSAGRQMYLVLMLYVKLQLETSVSKPVSDALEPAMNSIFDITPPECRKILNDAMDGSGRAILREMFKRYTRFGKWSGV